jgi:hypothetical protein
MRGPVPEPGEKPPAAKTSAAEVAGSVMKICGIAGLHTRRVLEAVVQSMASAPGYSPAVAEAQLVKAWRDYERQKPELRITWGAEKFFGDGHWRTPEAWPRKASQKLPDPCAREDESPRIHPEEVARWKQARDRGENLPEHIAFALSKMDPKATAGAA